MEQLRIKVADKLAANPIPVLAAAAVVTPLVARIAYRLFKGKPMVAENGKWKDVAVPADAYDAICVGGGPSGSTCAYFFAKAGGKIAVLEKETFPRDKYCGEVVLR